MAIRRVGNRKTSRGTQKRKPNHPKKGKRGTKKPGGSKWS